MFKSDHQFTRDGILVRRKTRALGAFQIRAHIKAHEHSDTQPVENTVPHLPLFFLPPSFSILVYSCNGRISAAYSFLFEFTWGCWLCVHPEMFFSWVSSNSSLFLLVWVINPTDSTKTSISLKYEHIWMESPDSKTLILHTYKLFSGLMVNTGRQAVKYSSHPAFLYNSLVFFSRLPHLTWLRLSPLVLSHQLWPYICSLLVGFVKHIGITSGALCTRLCPRVVPADTSGVLIAGQTHIERGSVRGGRSGRVTHKNGETVCKQIGLRPALKQRYNSWSYVFPFLRLFVRKGADEYSNHISGISIDQGSPVSMPGPPK